MQQRKKFLWNWKPKDLKTSLSQSTILRIQLQASYKSERSTKFSSTTRRSPTFRSRKRQPTRHLGYLKTSTIKSKLKSWMISISLRNSMTKNTTTNRLNIPCRNLEVPLQKPKRLSVGSPPLYLLDSAIRGTAISSRYLMRTVCVMKVLSKYLSRGLIEDCTKRSISRVAWTKFSIILSEAAEMKYHLTILVE